MASQGDRGTSDFGFGSSRRRRWAGWGFEGVRFEPPAEMVTWLEERVGPAEPFPRIEPTEIVVPEPRPVPGISGRVSREPSERLARARGQGLPDLLRLRVGALPALPDAVALPGSAEEVEAILRVCAESGTRVIPRGGGTSVTGGVNVLPDGPPVVVLDLGRLSGLRELDERSGLALFSAGTAGPEVERALGDEGFTLGHFPQSWELSTVGGWVAARASGQESLGYGSIRDLVAGVEVVAPAGRLRLPAFPATAAGPDLRQLVLGSEGRLGVITDVTLRVRKKPPPLTVWAALLPTWEQGLDAARELVQAGVPLHLLRLSNEPETEVAMAVGLSGHRRLAPLVRGWLRLRGIPDRGRGGCLLLLGTAGEERRVRWAEDASHHFVARRGGVSLGRGPGRHWVRDRFRHPYLRDALLDRGWATDTLETAAPWSRLPELAATVNRAIEGALAEEEDVAADEPPTDPAAEAGGERVASLCHVSHPYRDGASLYFTFFYRCSSDFERALERWARIKRAATEAVVAGGGTLSHHHGVGSWHAPWLGREIGADGVRLLASAVRELDPQGVLNPGVLLESTTSPRQ